MNNNYGQKMQQKDKVILSTLAKTWILDLDGTIVKHNGYKIDGKDTLLLGVKEFVSGISSEDKIIILTSRKIEYRDETLKFLDLNDIRYDLVLFDMPMGERIVVNDRKESGLDMAVAFNIDRDVFGLPEIIREK